MGITSLLPIFVSNVITDDLQVRTKATIAALVNNITLPFDLHFVVDIIHPWNGCKVFADFCNRVCSVRNHGHNVSLHVLGLFIYQPATGMIAGNNFDIFDIFLQHIGGTQELQSSQ